MSKHPENDLLPAKEAARLRRRISDLESALIELKLRSEALQKSEDKLQTLISCLDDAVFVVGMDGIFNRYYRHPARETLFLPTKDLLGKHISDVLPADTADLFQRALNAVEAYGKSQQFDFSISTPAGEGWYNARLSPYRSKDAEYFGYVCVVRDVTARKRLETSLRESEVRYRSVMEKSPECILLADIDTRVILEANAAMQRLLGYTPSELPGMSLYDLMAKADEDIYGEILKIIEERSYFKGERRYRRKDGSVVDVELSVNTIQFSDKTVLCVISRDVTPRKLAESQLTYTATHDPLTGLVNRLLLYDRLAQQLASARRREALFALINIDLDQFKAINDTQGHGVGDQLLKAVGIRLKTILRRGTDTLARMGGDEYMIILAEILHAEEGETIAGNVLDVLRRPYELEGLSHHITPSIGIAIYPLDGRTSEELIKAADMAMYAAKSAGRNRFRRFSPEMAARNLPD